LPPLKKKKNKIKIKKHLFKLINKPIIIQRNICNKKFLN